MRHLKIGKVEQYLLSKLEAGEEIYFLIDPEESSPENASMIASKAEEAGSDGIMVGGQHSSPNPRWMSLLNP